MLEKTGICWISLQREMGYAGDEWGKIIDVREEWDMLDKSIKGNEICWG